MRNLGKNVLFCHKVHKKNCLRRFEERNNELETQFIQLREDKADVVAFLKRTLQQRTDTIHVSSKKRAKIKRYI